MSFAPAGAAERKKKAWTNIDMGSIINSNNGKAFSPPEMNKERDIV